MEKKDQKSRIMRLLAQVVIIMAGLSVYAAGVALFVLPMDMIAAGTTGLGLVAQHYWGDADAEEYDIHPVARIQREVRVCLHPLDVVLLERFRISFR